MTMCFKEVGQVSSARSILDNLVVGMDKVGVSLKQRIQNCTGYTVFTPPPPPPLSVVLPVPKPFIRRYSRRRG